MFKTALAFCTLAGSALLLSGCFGYDGSGPIPEEKHGPVAPMWTDADVDAVVDIHYETLPALLPVTGENIPAACQNVQFLRFTPKALNGNAQVADAALLLVPGILEGANGFEYIGRQLVYMAKTQRDRNIEIWAMDRRSNCLEDLAGFQAAEAAATAAEAENIILDYYYGDMQIDGKGFVGFLQGDDVALLSQFGVEQTTTDMYTIIQHYFPNAADSRQKVFVGGHSLGGAHTSIFLSWDLDGDATTTSDIGANMVAGAVGFDTFIGAVDQGLPGGSTLIDIPALWNQAMGQTGADANSDTTYRQLVRWIENGYLPRNIDIPQVFSAEAIAIPEAVGILSAKDPEAEASIIKRVPKSPVLRNLFRFFHTRDGNNFINGPYIEDFRYTNEATVGLMFDDHFSILSFLQTSIGHLNGGPVVEKSPAINWLREAPLIGTLISAINGKKTQHIAANAGPDRQHLGQGPLYSWASMDEIGSLADPDYTSVDGKMMYTSVMEEVSRVEDFSRALYIGPTNLTEWYFPLRILIDLTAASKSYAPANGINTLNQDSYKLVPTLLFIADGGVTDSFDFTSEIGERDMEVIELIGHSHLDPMFATVNTPQLHENKLADNLLDFLINNSQ